MDKAGFAEEFGAELLLFVAQPVTRNADPMVIDIEKADRKFFIVDTL